MTIFMISNSIEFQFQDQSKFEVNHLLYGTTWGLIPGMELCLQSLFGNDQRLREGDNFDRIGMHNETMAVIKVFEYDNNAHIGH